MSNQADVDISNFIENQESFQNFDESRETHQIYYKASTIESQSRETTTKRYKPFKVARTLKAALLHRNCSGVGHTPLDYKTCPCCDRKSKRGYSLLEIFSIGPSKPMQLNSSILMYFNFNTALLKITMILILGNLPLMYQLHQAYCRYLALELDGETCSEGLNLYSYFQNPSYLLDLLKLKKKNQDISAVLDEMRLGILCSLLSVWMTLAAAFWIFTKHVRIALKIKYRNRKRRIGGFSLMLTSFENKDYLETDIKDHFESILQESGFSDQVNILAKVYSTELIKVESYQEEIAHLVAKVEYLSFIARSSQTFERGLRRGCRRIRVRNEAQIKQLKKKVKKELEMRPYLKDSSKAEKMENCVGFVTLSSWLTRDRILRSYKDKYSVRPWILCGCCFKTKKPRFVISEAPEPQNIQWKHIGTLNLKKISNRYLSYILLMIFFALVLYLLYLLAERRNRHEGHSGGPKGSSSARDSEIRIILPSPVISYLLVELIQQVSKWVTKKVCSVFDKEYIKSELVITQSLSLGLLKVVVLLPLHKVLVLDSGDSDPENVMITTRVVLLQALLKPFMRVFMPENVIKFAKVNYIKLKRKFKGSIGICQDDLNKLFSKPKCRLENLYSEDVYIVVIAFLSIVYNPAVSITCLAYFLVKICADRLLLLKFYAEPEIDSVQLSINMFQNIGLLVKTTGIFLFLRQTNEIPLGGSVSGTGTNVFYLYCYTFANFSILALIFFPFGYFTYLISRRLERRYLVERTERDSVMLASAVNPGSLVDCGFLAGDRDRGKGDWFYKGVVQSNRLSIG